MQRQPQQEAAYKIFMVTEWMGLDFAAVLPKIREHRKNYEHYSGEELK